MGFIGRARPRRAMDCVAINRPVMGREEISAAGSVIRDGMLTSAAYEGGPRVRAFERAAASFIGSRYAVAVNSGTAALQAALHALDIGRGDEVLVPSFTFVATANAVVSTGARPVFVDISRDNYTMSAADLGQKVSKRTRAIVPVHLYGNVADVEGISEISRRYNVPVIEDAAQSMGSSYRGKQTGRFFEMGCFSMYPGKVMTAGGEGGFVTTDKKRLRDRLLMIRNHGMLKGCDTGVLGMNMRLPEIGAAIAEVQTRKLPRFLAARRRNAALLSELLAGANVTLPSPRRREEVNWYLYTVASERRDALKSALGAGAGGGKRGGTRNGGSVAPGTAPHAGGARVRATAFAAAAYYSVPVHRMPLYRNMMMMAATAKLSARGLANTDWAAARVLSLPVHPKVTKGQIRIMAEITRQNV